MCGCALRRLAGLFLAVNLLGSAANAEDLQQMFLNGEVLTQEQLVIFKQLVGAELPSGHYWLDDNTGLWGYGDYPSEEVRSAIKQGVYEQNAAQNAPEQGADEAPEKKEYFEDRMGKYGFDIPPIQY